MRIESSWLLWLLPVVLLVGLDRPVQAEPMFQGLGDVAGGDPYSVAYGISGDGSVAVGASKNASGLEAFRWTSESGMVGIGELPGGVYQGLAFGASHDGTTIVGYSFGAGNDGGTQGSGEAFRWTSEGGMVGLGDFPGGVFASSATAVSADGSIVIGRGSHGGGNYEAAMWPSGGGMLHLGYLPANSNISRTTDISADGSTVVGHSFKWGFVWTSAGGMVSIGGMPGGNGDSDARAISADGSTVVGSADKLEPAVFGTSTWAIRWTSLEGVVPLGSVPEGSYESEANSVSADGSTIVGVVHAPAERAFIWDEVAGMRFLDVVLTDLGLDLTGWTLGEATGISNDGRVIVGEGLNPNGDIEGWIANLGDTEQVPALGPVALSVLAGLLAATGGLRPSGPMCRRRRESVPLARRIN